MELWIISQDRETLIKCGRILLEESGDKYVLLDYITSKEWFRLGFYKSKERALEVLDDIESLLCGNTRDTGLVKGIGINSKNAQNLIYEMPEN